MTIEAKIIKDSVGPNGVRLTTFVLKYPRFIHSEMMTHRAFSRNASSSRAIPFTKQMQMIKDDMAIPLEFRKNQRGMQAGEPIENQQLARDTWIEAGHEAIKYAEELDALGIHKQYVNRLVEPYSHISVVVTATEYSNFFALRHHSMAQPEIAELARIMWDQYSTSEPQTLQSGEWHLPFVSMEEIEFLTDKEYIDTVGNTHRKITDWNTLIKMSVARCARVSYLTHEGKKPSQEDDYKLYDRLLAEQPIHASPSEHQARAIPSEPCGSKDLSHNYRSGNFHGWVQYRKMLDGENITEFTGPLG